MPKDTTAYRGDLLTIHAIRQSKFELDDILRARSLESKSGTIRGQYCQKVRSIADYEAETTLDTA
jgi:hypothetical protein